MTDTQTADRRPSLAELERDFREAMNSLTGAGRKRHWQVFRDFCELGYCAIAKPCQPDQAKAEALESRYMDTVGRYEPEQADVFARMLGMTAAALNQRRHDFLGTIYEEEGFTDGKYGGQYWTPWHLCELMARMQFSPDDVQDTPLVTLGEPTCGSGRMVLAFAQVMEDSGLDPATSLWADATDLDRICFQITYIQLSLAGIPARVVNGNTLSLETFDSAVTPVGTYLLMDGGERAEIVHALYSGTKQDSEQAAEPAPQPLPLQEGDQMMMLGFDDTKGTDDDIPES